MTTSSAEFGLDRIGQIAMTVTDTDRSEGFYRDILGIRPLFRAGNLAFFDCNGVRLMLSPPEKEGEWFRPILYFAVDDIASACQTLRSRGVEFDQPPHVIARLERHDLWMAFFRDPDRNLLALMSDVVRPA